MSSVQGFTMYYDPTNVASGIATKDAGIEVDVNVSALGRNVALRTTTTSISKCSLNDFAKSFLYPNNTAHPISADITASVFGSWSLSGNTARGYHYIDGVQIFDWSFRAGITSYTTTATATNLTLPAILNSTRNSLFENGLSATSGSAGFINETITFYFNRYDFSATAGSGISTTSVSSSTGYDGDTITYSCTLAQGAEFDGWYNGSVLVSRSQTYEHVVNGADIELTAKGLSGGSTEPDEKSLIVRYGADVLVIEDVTNTASIPIYYGEQKIADIITGSATLKCENRWMDYDVRIGERTLLCKDMMMTSDVIINVGNDENIEVTMEYIEGVLYIRGVEAITESNYSGGVLTLS